MKIRLNFLPTGWLWLVMAVLISPAQAADRYGYPILDPYAATVIGTPREFQAPLLPSQEVNQKRVELTVFPDRTQPALLWFNNTLHNGLISQHGKAPLIFIIAGTGGSFRSYKVRDLANYFYQAGFHVVTLSSPTHPNFIAAASSTQYPGSLEDDARDLYRVMQRLWQRLQKEIDVSDFYLTGYSLGATQAAFVAKLDDQYKAFNFKKIFMINPAVNLYSSVKIFDDMFTNTVQNNPVRAADILDRATEALVSTYQEEEIVGFGENFLGEDALYLAYHRRKSPTRTDILPALIALSFRNSVANMVFVTDVVNNAGYIKPKNLILYPTDSLTNYFKVANQVSFIDYFHDLYAPFYRSKQPDLTEQGLINSAGLSSIEGYLRHTNKIGVVTNQDEIILAPGELDFLRRVFGQRLRVYPYGGHCGNINYKENVAYMLQFFNKRPRSKLRGIWWHPHRQRPLPQTQLIRRSLLFLVMQPLVGIIRLPLSFHVITDHIFITMLAHGTYEISITPKLTSPKLGLHRRNVFEDVPRRKTFNNLDNLFGTIRRHRLDQKMSVISINANF